MTNPFERLANAQMVAATKRKHKRAEVKIVKSERDAPMKMSVMEQEQADQSTQFRSYRRWKRAEIEVLKTGPHGDELVALARLLQKMSIDGVEGLIEYIDQTRFLYEATPHDRRVIMSMVADTIVRVRLENGLPPFDDSLPGEEPTAFEIIRKQLRTET